MDINPEDRTRGRRDVALRLAESRAADTQWGSWQRPRFSYDAFTTVFGVEVSCIEIIGDRTFRFHGRIVLRF